MAESASTWRIQPMHGAGGYQEDHLAAGRHDAADALSAAAR